MTEKEKDDFAMKQQQLIEIMKNTMNSARSKQAELERGVEMWRDYQSIVEKLESLIAKSHFLDEPTASLDGLNVNINKINVALTEIQVNLSSAIYVSTINR